MNQRLTFLKRSLILFLGICLFSQSRSVAQSKQLHMFFGAGPSYSGSGDIVGLTVLNEIQIPIGNRMFINPGFQFTRHGGTHIYGNKEYRYLTAGINLHVDFNYALLETAKHRIAIGVGPYVRHQIDTDAGVGFRPGPQGTTITDIDYYYKMKSLSVGYHIAPSYYLVLSKRIIAGARVAFQNDTNGDVSASSTLMIGVSL